MQVSTHRGAVDVTLRAPPAAAPDERADEAAADGEAFDFDADAEHLRAANSDAANPDDDDDLDDPLEALSWVEADAEGGPLDAHRRERIEDLLDELFHDTPEGAATSDLQGHRLFMDQLADTCGCTIASATTADVRQVLFDAIPRSVSIEPSAADHVIGDLRAFYQFLDRAYGLPQAAACLRLLDAAAVRRLATNLADRRRFGPAKALVMAGRDAGFDVDTQEGLEAWLREASSRPLPPSPRSPTVGPPTAPPRQQPAKGDKKRHRKAARAARKRNR